MPRQNKRSKVLHKIYKENNIWLIAHRYHHRAADSAGEHGDYLQYNR